MEITGAELFVKALKEESVKTLFAYPGGQAIDLFNALYGEKEIDVILPRHEQGLVHAADGYARSTGEVGVCLVTSGPGATNLVTGIATANPIVADAKKAICALLEKAKPLHISEWIYEINRWKMEYPIDMEKSGLTPQMVIQSINELFEEAVITTDVGQNQLWTTQFLDIDENKQMLTSGGLGTMGYGFPAAIGAKLGNPHKDVIVISGDGGMQMNIQEMATAIVYELP